MNLELKEIIDKCDYISFDIFDTLIFRNVMLPKDIFYLSNEIIKKKNIDSENWMIIRIDAEKKLRKISNSEEITFDEIYEYINFKYKDILKENELKLELNFSQKNHELFDIYKYCLKMKKKILITSDMYLPKSVIEKMLSKCDYEKYDKLYLSSEIKKTKSTGSLFEYILNDLNINPNSLLHIGDNIKSDYNNPKRLGINAFHYIRKKNSLFSNNIKTNIINSFISNNNYNLSYFYNRGYECLGPLLFGLSNWATKKISNKEYDMLLFLSRDGLIIKNSFDIMSNKNNKYIYVSRKSLTIPTLWKYSNIIDSLNNMHLSDKTNLKVLLNKFGLNQNDVSDEIEKYKIEVEKSFNINNIPDNIIGFVNSISSKINENSKKQYKNFKKYIESLHIQGKVAIFDIGWYGNMQFALQKLLNEDNISIDGFYVGVCKEGKENIQNMNGYLFDKNSYDLYNDEKHFNSLFELIFTASHGSTIGYDNNGKPVFEDSENSKEFFDKTIGEFQKGALQFVKDFYDSKLYEYLDFSNKDYFYNLSQLGNHPTYEDAKNFLKIVFSDEIKNKLGETHGFKYYFLHPTIFYSDFRKSNWKIGFLKYNIPFNINWHKVLKLIKKER